MERLRREERRVLQVQELGLKAFNDPERVRAEYGDESRFAIRRNAWTSYREGGEDADEVLIETVASLASSRALELGCGTGELAEALTTAMPALELRAVDVSPRMVELTSARGIDARVADAGRLPFGDAQFDCVIAARMLYHVPDLDGCLEEIARVLRPQGKLLALTLATVGLPELWHFVGAEGNPGPKPFNRDNGEGILARQFAQVERRDLTTRLTFPDRDAVVDYVAATLTRQEYAGEVPDFDGPFETRLLQTLFVAGYGAIGKAVPVTGGASSSSSATCFIGAS